MDQIIIQYVNYMRIKMKGNEKAWSGIKSIIFMAIWDYKKSVKSYDENMKELATKFNVSNMGMVNIVETYWKR